jgi:hypothetical protein
MKPTTTEVKSKKPVLTLLLLVYFVSLSVFAQKEVAQKPLSNAKIQFTEKQHDFGDVVQGDVVTHKFAFQNTGTEPLMILNVQTTCGCTAPEWPKKPIPPGEGGEIVVTFNSKDKIGRVNKVITVFNNGVKPEEKLKIVSNILPVSEEIKTIDQPLKTK